jgi:hypothetical protein
MSFSAQQEQENQAGKASRMIGESAAGAGRGEVNMAGACAQREKYWHELSDAEKIDRMHGVVKGLLHTIDGQRRELGMLRRHQHSGSGELMIPANHAENSYGGLSERQISKDRGGEGVYF